MPNMTEEQYAAALRNANTELWQHIELWLNHQHDPGLSAELHAHLLQIPKRLLIVEKHRRDRMKQKPAKILGLEQRILDPAAVSFDELVRTREVTLTDYTTAVEQLAQAKAEVRKLTRIVEELDAGMSSISQRFKSLFGIPADTVMPMEVGRNPKHPGQWMIRVHVKAFTVEATMGELAAARQEPGRALSWSRVMDDDAAPLRDALKETVDQAKIHVAFRILDSENEIESIQSVTTTPTEESDDEQ